MSRILINRYLSEIDRTRRFSGSQTEEVIREAFKSLLRDWSRDRNLFLQVEYSLQTPQKKTVKLDGAVLHELRVPLGYWEAKDTADVLDREIERKLRKGYPQENILFEDSATAVLIQNRVEVMRCAMTDVEALERLLRLFFDYERPEIAEFRKAVAQFSADLPAILEGLRAAIATAYRDNAGFTAQAAKFLDHAKGTINPTLTEEDVREMLIQHILTEEIFTQVFNDSQYHRENNIARELSRLEDAFFTGSVRRNVLDVLKTYYASIKSNAALITSHAEKQKFLKLIYEGFYKVYNPKAADRLGVVYTPNEIVRFMIEGADWLCHTHFGKTLIEPGVEILDPATGTGTFICELIEHFRGQPQALHRKYKEELHANEVAILPYYVANLNIEATYAAAAGQYAEFPNLCFVDTLDNVAGLGIKAGHQHDLFAALSEENVERVRRQNSRKISVVIGNPPYNANQQNENDNNKNRAYPKVDDLIKRSFVKLSTAQKTKVYDMYARFFRWSFDRVHDDGIIAFVTNRSFIDSRTFDGFRRYVKENFAEAWIVDLGGDVRANPKISGTKHNVFGIQTGVAISFLVKRKGAKQCLIRYVRRPEFDTAEDKRAWLGSTRLSEIGFDRVVPDKAANWINLTSNDWDSLIPVADKRTKAAKTKGQERAVFKLFSLGVVTARDDWVYDLSQQTLIKKMSYLTSGYNDAVAAASAVDAPEAIKIAAKDDIKWTRSVKRNLEKRRNFSFKNECIIEANYRPFFKTNMYRDEWVNEMSNLTRQIFLMGEAKTRSITLMGDSSGKPYFSLAIDTIPDYNFVSPGSGGTQTLPRYRYTSSGERIDNITDWAVATFTDHYGKTAGVTRDGIFAYVYAALHDPLWRETYAINLKREFPRIPLHPHFGLWAGWGQRLLDLHIGYEGVEPWPLTRRDTPDERARSAGLAPKVILKSDPAAGTVTLDSETVLSGIPAAAWDYRLGNRSAIDWVLDQHKEKTPKDPTIRAKFNTYRFANHKDRVADLLARVVRVSVETMGIVAEIAAARRG
ncbi:MAG: N-6 DNA methylase [Rhodobacter sp.]|nr:N-6 DNA methylase [Rhodobacter sp.]MCA3462726.1 N-6 DNA methylase [Rhodobacter sp.]MCA3463480.1 N-6 DNA methylase [Rhodobacter sp.]MCA3466736.1 N-6 DNA methylase [Rhodobacter sp.]MCA3472077.1 N-6 DNA methylase [Rhodobacter sp.]